MTTPARRRSTWTSGDRLGIIALLAASLTGGAAIAAGDTQAQVLGAGAHVVLAAVALFHPTAIVAQVLAGQILAGSLLLQPARASLPIVGLVVAGVVCTAELLGIAARMDPSARHAPLDDLRRAALSTVLAGAVFVIVAILRVLPGPSGFFAVVLASAACIAAALALGGYGADE